MAAQTVWKANERGVEVSTKKYLRHLARSGALDEAEALFDDLDLGAHVLEPVNVDEFLATVRKTK